MVKNKWVGYRVWPDGHETSLRPGGKRVFGDLAKVWLQRRAKLLKQKVRFSAYVPSPHRPPTLTFDRLTHFSPHFSKREFACHDGTVVPLKLEDNAIRLANALEKLRAHIGKPLHLASVYRTPEYNKKVHGARNSRHTYADAADIDMQAMARLGVSHNGVLTAAEAVPEIHGIGIYPDGSIHVDTRPGSRVFWNDWIRQ